MLSIAQSGTNTTRFGWALPPDERCQGIDNSLICSYKQANPKDMEPEARDWVTGLVDRMIDEATSRSRAASTPSSYHILIREKSHPATRLATFYVEASRALKDAVGDKNSFSESILRGFFGAVG